MESVLYLGVFWSIYGIAGLLGVQAIPSKFKWYSWTRDYICDRGKTWLILGTAWIALSIIFSNFNINSGWAVFAIIAVAIPALIYSVFIDKKYEKRKMGDIE